MASHILLVEDDEHDLSFTNRALELCLASNEVQVARDGEEALCALEQDEKPSLILLDLKLPKVDGFTVLKRIRATPALEEVPVIVVSGSILETDRVRAMLLGANNYVAKSMDFGDFAQHLSLALSPYASAFSVNGRDNPHVRRANDRRPN
ncbi:MAG TPA: two-component system response regulator [Massilia sp.]|nr:two-component system response regulator [Massilia sp.]